jgi:hypothetical protein
MRQQPVPNDVLVLLRIAANDPEALNHAAKLAGRGPETIRAAAVLYLQQILWTPDADNYRALGVRPDAPKTILLEHLRWLMKWLHPDHQRSVEEAAFAERVIAAWNAIKTPERRAAYDLSLGRTVSKSQKTKSRRSARRVPWIVEPHDTSVDRSRLWWRLAALAVAVVGLAAVVTTDWSTMFVPRQTLRRASEAAPTAAPDRGGALVDPVVGTNEIARSRSDPN